MRLPEAKPTLESLIDERIGADQGRLHIGVDTLAAERDVAALVEVEVHPNRVPSAGRDTQSDAGGRPRHVLQAGDGRIRRRLSAARGGDR